MTSASPASRFSACVLSEEGRRCRDLDVCDLLDFRLWEVWERKRPALPVLADALDWSSIAMRWLTGPPTSRSPHVPSISATEE
ncbi:MAG: hypothetical protein Q9224_007142 [Gallowayella concinna]